MIRKGTSLVEVLVAMFIMTIGMLSLLALFPLGVLRMAQALRDERAGQATLQAKSIANLLDLRHEPNATAPKDYFKNPDNGTAIDAAPGYPSYPVFLDPVGWKITGGIPPYAGGTSNVRRINSSKGLQWFSLRDEISFDGKALTPQTVGGSLSYDPSFSWAYLLQQPNRQEPSIVDCSTVLFYRRPELQPSLSLAEGYFNQGLEVFHAKNTFKIPADGTGVVPKLKSGDWVLDCTVEKITNPLKKTETVPIPHSKFYRVLAVVDETPAYVEFEVHVPIQKWVPGTPPAPEILIIEGIYDVFENGPGKLP